MSPRQRRLHSPSSRKPSLLGYTSPGIHSAPVASYQRSQNPSQNHRPISWHLSPVLRYIMFLHHKREYEGCKHGQNVLYLSGELCRLAQAHCLTTRITCRRKRAQSAVAGQVHAGVMRYLFEAASHVRSRPYAVLRLCQKRSLHSARRNSGGRIAAGVDRGGRPA
jgi:hypothetical protein